MMATDKDYTGRVCADFIKRMFPDVMKDIELDSIRNFKFQPDTGSIVIDEPDKGDYHFHFDNKKIPCKHLTCKGLLFELCTQTRGRTGTGEVIGDGLVSKGCSAPHSENGSAGTFDV